MSSLSAEVVKAARKVVQDAVAAGQGDTISKKLLVQGVSKRLKLADDHFSKQQKNELAELARTLLDEEASTPASEEVASSSPLPASRKSKKPSPEKAPTPASESESDTPKKKSVPKKRKSDAVKGKQFRTAEFINSEGDPIDAQTAGYSVEDEEDEDEEVKPKKKAKSEPKEKGKKKDEKKPKATKKAAEPLDDEAEELKRLKSFVVACGDRKIWSKEFDKRDLDTPKKQIRWLKELLHELGMPSRMSLQAAKEIGQKRALEKEARELGITLQDTTVDAPRTKRAAAQRKPPPPQQLDLTSEEEDSDAATGDDQPANGRKKKTKVDSSDEDSDAESDAEAKKGKAKGKKAKGSGTYQESEQDDEDDDGASSSSGFKDSDSE